MAVPGRDGGWGLLFWLMLGNGVPTLTGLLNAASLKLIEGIWEAEVR